MLSVRKACRHEHRERHPCNRGLKREMLNDRLGGANLFADRWRVTKKSIVERLVKGYFDHFVRFKHFAAVPGDDCENDSVLGFGVELVFVGSVGKPVRPEATAGSRNCSQPNAFLSRGLNRTDILQSKRREELS